MSGDADNCREALDAAPARWTAFQIALQKHFKVAPDLYFVQMHLASFCAHGYQKTQRRPSDMEDCRQAVSRVSVAARVH